MAPLILSQCSVDDGPGLAANNIPAFWANPNWVLSWPHRTLEYHTSQIALHIPRVLLDDRAIMRHQKAVDPDTGCIFGYARWGLPTTHKYNPDDGTPTWPEGQVPAVGPEREAEIRRVAKNLVWDPVNDGARLAKRAHGMKMEVQPKTPHMTLEYLAVHPDNQRKGVGTILVKSGMDQADKLGLDIFVHAFEEGVALYKKMGFQLLAELIQDDSPYGGTGRVGAYFFLYQHGSRGPFF